MKTLKQHKQLKIYKEKRKIASTIKEGILGLKSLGTKQITSYQIEAARRCISRLTKRNSKLWIRVKCNVVKTKKSIGSRMGKGKGVFIGYTFNIKKGTVIFEVIYSTIISMTLLEKALLKAGKKLSTPVKIYKKNLKY